MTESVIQSGVTILIPAHLSAYSNLAWRGETEESVQFKQYISLLGSKEPVIFITLSKQNLERTMIQMIAIPTKSHQV